MRRSFRWALIALGAVAALVMPTTTTAVFPGERGRILFVSGVGGAPGDDSGADLYILSGPNGSITPLDTRNGQHRHPAWSPTLKSVAYALFDTANNEKIWVHDIASGTVDRLGPHASNVRDDRPSWSPSGNRIAYESEVNDGSGQQDILVKNITGGVTGGQVLNLTDSPNLIEGKPVWSPNGKTIFYSRRPMAGADDDILSEASDGSSAVPHFVINSGVAEYQPALSPNGKRMCFTRGPFGGTDADVYILELGNGLLYDLSDTALGAYNCAWSPDGEYVAYVRGVFSNGALVYEPSDDSGSAQLLTPDTASHFDGNPDWGPKSPAFCQGRPLTKAGTSGPDTILGRAERDVISSFGGNDVVRGKDGNDVLCGGDGDDRLYGGELNDALYGAKGNDRLDGDAGADTCEGGPGTDTLVQCEP